MEEEERKEGKGVVNMTRIFCQKGNENFWIDTFTKDVSIVVNVGVDSSLLWLPIVSRPTMISQQQPYFRLGGWGGGSIPPLAARVEVWYPLKYFLEISIKKFLNKNAIKLEV